MFSISLGRSTTLAVLVLSAFGAIASLAQTPAKTTAQQQTRIVNSYGRLPLAFEANRGQTDNQVRFLARGSGYGVFLTGQEAVLALHASPQRNLATLHNDPQLTSAPKTDVLRMQLLGANPSVEPHGAEPLSGTVNYFRGSDPSRWQSGVATFAKVEFTGVYPGVNLVYYGDQGQLEYDFVVAPKADPKAILLHFPGARKLQLLAAGDLTVQATNGLIVFHKPTIYQKENGRRQPVAGRFKLLANNTVSFSLGKYDHSRTLVIDPTLVYSTYLGGSTTDEAFGIAVDASGNTYIAGTTSSADFPTTSGSYQTTQKSAGHKQAFVTKLNPAGTALIYSTYIGGSDDDDFAEAIAVSAAGNAYITGSASSSDFPTTPGTFQASRLTLGGSTAFVTELNSSGTGLVYSTYLGGSFGGEEGSGIALDNSGDAYVAGETTANDFPVTAGAFAITRPGFRSATVTKLNPAGTGLVYSTYLGGSGYDWALAIALDAAGNAYVGGTASSTDFPVTPGAFQPTKLAPTNGTGFVTKLNPAGSALVYSTYLGGSDREQVRAIAVDAGATAYAAGFTVSSDFPVTSGAFQGASSPGAGFVTHLNTTGTALAYSTFLGPGSSQNSDGPHGIQVDSNGEAYVTGQSLPGFPVTPDAFQANCSTLDSAYVTRLNSSGTALIYSTCLGGTRGTFGEAIAIDAAGHAFVAGGTIATDFPVTSGAFQLTNNTNNQFVPTGFVAAFDTNPPAIGTTTTLTSSTNPATSGQTVTFDAAVDPASGSSTPTGNVVFNIDATDVATVALTAGAASYQTSTLTVGSHTVKASYEGDAQFTSSSDTITQTVQLPQTATPTFSPAPGTYTAAQNISISDSTTGATLYYSTDGSTPTTGSFVYAGPIPVAATTTIKAIATATGYTASPVASATYTIQIAGASLTPGTLTFANQTAGTTSTAKTATLQNTGNASLTISSITIAGTNPSDFSESNTCGASLAAGSSCTISVTFTPASAASYSATLTVTDNASGSPQVVALSGTGTAPLVPAASLTPSTLSFSTVTGTTSAAKAATLTNTGNAALAISSIGIAGTNPSDFSQTNTCGASLAAGSSCTLSVTFAPASVANFSATLSIADSASGSPHSVTLSGTGTAASSFTFSTSTPVRTVPPGGWAQFDFTVSAQNGAYAAPITFSASGLPAGATATFQPPSVTPGSSPATTTLTIHVSSASASSGANHGSPWPMGSPALALLFFAIPRRLRSRWSRRVQLTLLVLASLGAAAVVTGCGGSSAVPPHSSVTSTITVTATSGSDVHTTTVLLTVD